ncbi:hypothetical protein DY000_02030937 [Brassica cretica]|uniref:Uncharacterized protein n=1 Tax=Brassica cretica TaxID=69181 RepID=A0ABQ7DCX8_BRACR|nr:hypothetical protein DY000_02030937 [Brassica cretica]
MDSWSLEVALVTRRLREDKEVVVWNPKTTAMPEEMGSEPRSSGDPEVVEEPGGSPWILRSYWGPGGSLRP